MDPIRRELSIMPTTDRLAMSFGRVVRQVRRARRLTQAALGEAVGLSQSAISRIERGRVPGLSLHVIADLSDVLDIGVDLTLRAPWHADPLRSAAPAHVVSPPRQRDVVHARCSAYVRRRLQAGGWDVSQEVRIQTGRSHGFIDIGGFHRSSGSLLVGEVKTELGDLGELQRTVAWYLAEADADARRSGHPVHGRMAIVFVLDSFENAAFLQANAEAVEQAFPMRSRRLAAWLADPSASAIAGQKDGRGSSMALAMIDPARRSRSWLIATATDGRTSLPAYRDYRDAATRLRSKPRR